MISRTHSTSGTLVPPSTLVDLLRWRGEHQPDKLAYTFLVDGEAAEVRVTYGELDRQAQAIGATLQGLGAAGERVLLLYPSGLEYIAAFFGCLYAGAVAVPAYPPRFNRSLERIEAIVSDAQATVALTTADLFAKTAQWNSQSPALGTMPWLATDSLTDQAADRWQAPAITGGSLAFLQYTSGSTGMPKGVILSHANLLYNSQIIHEAFESSAQSVGVGWLPLYHDMGLIGNLLQPLYVGFPCVLMSPMAFLQRPCRWLQAISRYHGTISGGPNFAYDLCARKLTPAQRATLDLSQWTVAFNGAEPIRPEVLERFTQTFAHCGFRRRAFYPCYGLAEATLLVSGGRQVAPPVLHTVPKAALAQHQADTPALATDNTQTLVGCGTSRAAQQLLIVDPVSHTPCAPGSIGEIWLAGPSIAQGYWHRPQETAQTFQAHLADTGAGPFLRTGDLGFLLQDELFVTGRLKDVIIIRGSNHYPQDIEVTVEQSHPSLRPGCGAAIAVDVAGEERLVVVQEVERRYQPQRPHLPERRQTETVADYAPESPEPCETQAVVGSIRQAVAEQHGVQVYAVVLLRACSLPKTSSGKIQRYACKAGFLAQTLEAIGEWRAALVLDGGRGQNTPLPYTTPASRGVLAA